jgi:two-component system OmpR family response regulator
MTGPDRRDDLTELQSSVESRRADRVPSDGMHLLVVDDEPRLLDLLERGLKTQGFSVQAAANADDALALAREAAPALAVLDVMMPDADGFELLEALRQVVPGLPVIMLTARSAVEDRIHGLELGAVDYVVKPFSFRELTARIRAQIRRETETPPDVLAVNGMRLDLFKRELESPAGVFPLSDREFNLLAFLMRHPGQSLSRSQLADGAWDAMVDMKSNMVDVYIASLRQKLPSGAIKTVRGIGYRLTTP